MLSCLFIATTHQNSTSIYFSEQENTETKIFFLTFDYRKHTCKSVLTNLDLKDSQLHWVSSGKKKVLKDAKK